MLAVVVLVLMIRLCIANLSVLGTFFDLSEAPRGINRSNRLIERYREVLVEGVDGQPVSNPFGSTP